MIEVLATGSKGNCYLLKSGDTRLLLDCGIAYKKTLELMDFELPSAVLVTHEHKDHAKAAEDFIKHGVDVYMTCGTAMALGLEKTHRLHLIDDKIFSPDGRFKCCAFKVKHDAAEPVNFFITDKCDRILYLTDLKAVPRVNCLDATKILIETNYSEEELLKSAADEKQKRVEENHLSIERARSFFKYGDHPDLIHMSE